MTNIEGKTLNVGNYYKLPSCSNRNDQTLETQIFYDGGRNNTCVQGLLTVNHLCKHKPRAANLPADKTDRNGRNPWRIISQQEAEHQEYFFL
jgi:hypothetical protein